MKGSGMHDGYFLSWLALQAEAAVRAGIKLSLSSNSCVYFFIFFFLLPDLLLYLLKIYCIAATTAFRTSAIPGKTLVSQPSQVK